MEGVAYRLRVRVEVHHQFGLQLSLLGIRPASEAEDTTDGYSFFELVESSKYPVNELIERIHVLIDRYLTQPHLNQLVKGLLLEHADLFLKMPAASNMHHSYTAGLLEHVWSMTRISGFLADHYAKYYSELNPPLNRGIVVAAAILHDIGKIRELEYHPAEAKYTKEGCLIGHVLMGRDMVREAAKKIEGFPVEDLLLLEHAILSHHGKREFGAPILPQTIEALLVSAVDDLDAKINAVAMERIQSGPDGEFTEKVYPLDNRRIYKGIPVELPSDDAIGTM
jgi:3'-5' exoribonuclease